MRALPPLFAMLLVTVPMTLMASGCADEGITVPDCNDETEPMVCQVFTLVNQERVAAGVSPYRWSKHLAVAAERHALDMFENGYFNHASQDGRSFGDRADQAGYPGFASGENIAQGQQTAERVMQSWMNSSGHRANILSGGSDDIGIGYQGGSTWVQVFGRSD